MKKSAADFQNIYSQYHILVYNVSLNYLQNIEDAEEITQDVFVQIHHSFHNFEEKSALKTWIYRITINKCLDYIKHKSSNKRYFIFGKKSHNESEYLNASDFEHPGIQLENQENSKMLFEVINKLPEKQKIAFMLSKMDLLSNPEISRVMQLSVSAVESLIFRAKINLRDKLSQKFDTHRKKK